MTTATTSDQNTNGPFVLTHARLSQPLRWILEGWRDLCHTPLASLAYGALVSVLGAIILGYASHPYFVVASISAFLLVGPVMTAGLCELSRRREAGEQSRHLDMGVYFSKACRIGSDACRVPGTRDAFDVSFQHGLFFKPM